MVSSRTGTLRWRLARRRCIAAFLLTGRATALALASADSIVLVELWIDLSEPVPADAGDAAEAASRRDRVALQQRAVSIELQRLGAVELARVRHARNAIAVRLPRSQLDAVRTIPGVLRVRPAEGLHPPKPTGSI